jgi:cysteine desulfurase
MELPIYLDHHSTTPCDPRVVEAMLPYFSEQFGNPASLTHEHGRRAANAVDDARIAVARFFHVQPNEIFFTAGATESNNIAFNLVKDGGHVVTSPTEHSSVFRPAQLRDATFVPVDGEGFVDPDDVRKAIRPNTRLVSIEAANGEIGTVQRIAEIGAVCRERGVLFHSDITQAAGKIPLDLAQVDLASISGHKLYGPKGIGALLARRHVRVAPLVVGGGQEKGVRSGTVNVPGVVGLGAAFRLRAAEMDAEAQRLTQLRDDLRARIEAEIAGASVNGPRALRLPGNLNVSFERVEADSLMISMRRFSLSSGSACASGERTPSRVLTAIGVSEALAIGSIRIGLGKSNTAEQLETFVEDLQRSVRKLREISAA